MSFKGLTRGTLRVAEKSAKVLNRTFFIGLHKEQCFESAI